MASRSNKNARGESAGGAMTYRRTMTTMPASTAQPKAQPKMMKFTKTVTKMPSVEDKSGNRLGPRRQVGPGTREQARAAIDRDNAAAAAGARAFAQKPKRLAPAPAPNTNLGLKDVSAVNAVKTIKKKQASDKKAIEDMSQ